MIALLALAATLVTLLVSALTACAVAVRGMASPARAVVGPPPAGIGAEAVSVPSGTGETLAGWFAPGRPGRGAVLLLHGIRSDRRALASRMALLARAGTAVLAVDFRAHGESPGGAITFGHLEARDAEGALAWLRAAAPGERVGAIGISLGGAALALASRRVPVDAMVLEAVFPDIRAAVTNRLALALGPRLGRAVAPTFLAIGTGLTGLRPADLRPIEALARYAGPVLVASGALDRATTPAESRALHAAAAGPKELWLVAGAGHVDLAAAAGSDYERRVLAFLGRHLHRTVPCA
jgi:pimeloyl-ACP methyl ester carboxylesterase